MSLNLCQFIGRLQADPEVTMVQDGKLTRAVFSLAVMNHWKDSDGHRAQHTEWVDFVAFGNMGLICKKFLRKGSKVYISGKLSTSKWIDKTSGGKRKRTRVLVDRIQFLERRRKPGTPLPPPEADDEPDVEAKEEPNNG